MPSSSREDLFFEKLAGAAEAASSARERASSRLKSRIYSALQQRQAQSGPIRSISKTKADGMSLCVFEELVEIAPVGEEIKSRNFCRVCHARLAGERWENALIFWPNCPYVRFQNR